MAIATLTDILTGVKLCLGTITGLTGYAIEPASPKFPCAWPFFRRPAADYDQTFDGAMTWRIMLTVAVQAADMGHAQTNLQPYLAATGAKSIKAAFDADVTLGGLPGVSASVLRVEEIGPIQVAGAAAWAATLPLDVMAS